MAPAWIAERCDVPYDDPPADQVPTALREQSARQRDDTRPGVDQLRAS